jgi:hypothetical protein
MESVFAAVQSLILEGNAGVALKAMMLLVIAALWWYNHNLSKQAVAERKELTELYTKQLAQTHAELLEVIEKYQEGNIKSIEAINELKVLIAAIGSKI